MPLKLAMLSEKRGLKWVIIGFSDLFSGNLLQEEMEHRSDRFAEKKTKKNWAGDPEPLWDNITPRHIYHSKTKVRNSYQFETESATS